MKKCELCNSTAKMYCDSDQASLCWDCDTRVHTANFLVAKHSRTLLCHACQSPTPWTASGPKLGPSTVSVCQACANRSSSTRVGGDRDLEHNRDDDDDDEDGSEDEDDRDANDEDDDDDSSDDGGDEDDDGDNQVVPFSSTPLPPPLVSSSSSSEDSSKRSSQRRDSGGTSSRIGFFSNNSNQNGRFSNDFSIERSRQKGNYKISSRTSQ